MRPEPIRRKGRKTLAKVYDSLSGPEEAADRSRIIGLPTKKEAHDSRNELTAAAWAGGKSVSRIPTAKEYISVVEPFFRKLRAIKNAETRTRRRVFRPCRRLDHFRESAIPLFNIKRISIGFFTTLAFISTSLPIFIRTYNSSDSGKRSFL